MGNKMDRLEALKQESEIKKQAARLTSLFAQIGTESEFIEAIGDTVPDTKFASLLWHTLAEHEDGLRILYRHGHSHDNEQ